MFNYLMFTTSQVFDVAVTSSWHGNTVIEKKLIYSQKWKTDVKTMQH
jgi:hypothetical protein